MDTQRGMCDKCRYFIRVDAEQEYCRCPHCGQRLNVREAIERFRRAAMQPYLQDEPHSIKISFCGETDESAKR